MDIGTEKELAVAVIVYELARKILGPTADYLGKELKTWIEKKLNNLKNIFSNAERKLGDRIETEGGVPPKVLKGILDEGSFCDDSLAQEYFGGVLASSRSGTSRDNRGAYFIALISRLSNYQIRTHYVFYHILKKLFNGTNINPKELDDRRKTETYAPLDIYYDAMEFDEQEQEKTNVLLPHIMFGLKKENLIGDEFSYGPKEYMSKFFKKATKPGIIFFPSIPGIELFHWAHGKPDLTYHEFFNSTNHFEIDSKINIASGYQKTGE